jgi:hypothetical protein
VTYAFTQDVPIDAAFYQRIMDGLGDTKPPGLIVHTAVEIPGGGLRYLDIWESEQDCDRFTSERLHPVIGRLLAEVFGDNLPPEPPRQPVQVVHVWGP